MIDRRTIKRVKESEVGCLLTSSRKVSKMPIKNYIDYIKKNPFRDFFVPNRGIEHPANSSTTKLTRCINIYQ
jgi:hypothetical protein